jgi:hypothetical protein
VWPAAAALFSLFKLAFIERVMVVVRPFDLRMPVLADRGRITAISQFGNAEPFGDCYRRITDTENIVGMADDVKSPIMLNESSDEAVK